MDELRALGAEVRAAFGAWLDGVSAVDDAPGAGELLDALLLLEADAAAVAGIEEDAARLERLLTAGFFPDLARGGPAPGGMPPGAAPGMATAGAHAEARSTRSRAAGGWTGGGEPVRASDDRAAGEEAGPARGGGAMEDGAPAAHPTPGAGGDPGDVPGRTLSRDALSPPGRSAPAAAVAGDGAPGPRGGSREDGGSAAPPAWPEAPETLRREGARAAPGPALPDPNAAAGEVGLPPQPVRRVGGLGELAALAGRGGIELPGAEERQAAGGTGWSGTDPRAAGPAPWAEPAATADRHPPAPSAGPREDARAAGGPDAAPAPDGSAGATAEDRPEGRRWGRLRLPFLRHPAEPGEREEAEAIPPGGTVAGDALHAVARGAPAAPGAPDAEREGVRPAAFLALAARVARPRPPAAEEEVPAVPTLGGHTRRAEPPPPPVPVPPAAAAPELTELMDALAEEIRREYRRHYGE